MIVSKREDLAGIFLSAFLKGVLNDHTLRELVQFTDHVLDHLEEVEQDGKEATLILALMIRRAGGTVTIHHAELEKLRECWMQKRSDPERNTVKYRVVDHKPRGA